MEHGVSTAEETSWIQEDADTQIRTSNDTEVLLEEEEPTELVEDRGSGEKGKAEVSTAKVQISTASATPEVSTAAENLLYIRRSAEKRKDKGKGIMIEPEPEKKTKLQQRQERASLEAAIRLEEQFNEEESQRIARDAEIARQLHEEINIVGQEEVIAKDDEAHVIDWSDPAVIRFHAQQNRPFSIAEVKKNICTYLKNQGGYKMSDFKGMTYEEIRPIFEKDEASSFVKKPYGGRRKKSLARKRATETLSEESVKKQKLEDDAEEEELQVYLNIVPEDEGLDVESLATNAILYDFDKQDVLELYRLVKERFQTARLEGYDLLLWGDLKTMIEPNEEDKVWRNQQDWNLISWKLHNFCGVYVILMNNGFVIHIMVEKKYPLSQDILSKMLSRKLEVDHQSEMGYELIRFVKTQIQE
ncbi:hypothetical protein Tco_1034088 [Tanacetum coccineum]